MPRVPDASRSLNTLKAQRLSVSNTIGGISLHLSCCGAGLLCSPAAIARQGLQAKFERLALAEMPDLTGEALRKRAEIHRQLFFARMRTARFKTLMKQARRAPVEGAPNPDNTDAATRTGDGVAAR